VKKADPDKPTKAKPLVGGVRHDDRGNAVWQWATETARHAVASTSQLLRRLDVSSLKLEELDEDEAAPKAQTRSSSGASAAGAKPTAPGSKARGFNPYDGAAITRAPATHNPAAKKKPPARARTSWWRRLFQRR
jgi:hypothetical protein